MYFFGHRENLLALEGKNMQNSSNLSGKEHLWTSKKIEDERFLRILNVIKNGIMKNMYAFTLNTHLKE